MSASRAFAILDTIEDKLDRQISPLELRTAFDVPDYREYTVKITAGDWRQFGMAMNLLEKLQ